MVQDNRIDFNQLAKPANLQNSAVLRFLEEEEERKRLEKAGLKRVAWPPPPEDQNYADFIEQHPVQVKTRGVGEYATYENKSSSYVGEDRSSKYQPQAQPVCQPSTPQSVYQPMYQPAYEPLYESPYETPYEPSFHVQSRAQVTAPQQPSNSQEQEQESASMPRTPWVSVGPSVGAQPQSQYQGLSPLKSGPPPQAPPVQQRPPAWGAQPQAAAPARSSQQQQPAWNTQPQAAAPVYSAQQHPSAGNAQPQAAPAYSAQQQPPAWNAQPQAGVPVYLVQQQPPAWSGQPQGPVQGYFPQQQQPAWSGQPQDQGYLPQQYLPAWNAQPQAAVQPSPQPNAPQQRLPTWGAQSQPQPQTQPQPKPEASLPAWGAQPQVQNRQAFTQAPVQAPAPACSPSPNTCQQQYYGTPPPAAPQERVQSPQPNYHQSQNTASNFEPPPSVITLRPEVPISQVPAPVYQAQPAATNPISGSMRGDLKWPPPNVKEQMREEEQARLELEKGPACRPPRITKDYRSFFAQYASTNNYPGYRVPPGTQYFTPAYHR